MRRRRRFFALLFIVTAFITPLGFFYFTIANENRNDDFSSDTRFQTLETENEPVSIPVKDFSKYSELECSKFPSNVAIDWLECLSKMAWIRSGWKTHQCYTENQVDGSECSFRYYLSEIEQYCPPLDVGSVSTSSAKMSPSLRRLLPILEGVPHYMSTRIRRLWSSWKTGAHLVLQKYQRVMEARRKLNVLVFIGFLANEQKIKFAKKSDHGGPLGELLQWSDLLASLSIIGHHLEVSTDKSHMRSIVHEYTSRGPCQYINGSRQHLDIIFTDIMGLNILRQHHRQFLISNRCRIRLLDSFGTHAEFSNKTYFIRNKKSLSGNFSQRNPWGGHGLDLRQHWTFYPHSDDNTFLGFVVDDVGIQKTSGADDVRNSGGKLVNALVYGKEQYMWKDAEKPIGVLKKFAQVHATVADLSPNSSKIFENVKNHGFLNPEQISQLLDTIDIFFGLGFPLEGPAPLEAIAHGAVFVNAKFREPKSRRNYRFLAEKPTLREWTSQNPYMEMLGEPHVLTVDIENEHELEAAIRKAVKLKPSPKTPFEFTPAGMLLRVAVLLEKQQFCDKIAHSKIWPPIEQMQIFKSKNSCEEECHSRKLLCEPSFFAVLNSKAMLEKHFSCPAVSTTSSPIAPFNCTLQATPTLFSCASNPEKTQNVIRLCPCRDFIPEQHAVCQKCI